MHGEATKGRRLAPLSHKKFREVDFRRPGRDLPPFLPEDDGIGLGGDGGGGAKSKNGNGKKGAAWRRKGTNGNNDDIDNSDDDDEDHPHHNLLDTFEATVRTWSDERRHKTGMEWRARRLAAQEELLVLLQNSGASSTSTSTVLGAADRLSGGWSRCKEGDYRMRWFVVGRGVGGAVGSNCYVGLSSVLIWRVLRCTAGSSGVTVGR